MRSGCRWASRARATREREEVGRREHVHAGLGVDASSIRSRHVHTGGRVVRVDDLYDVSYSDPPLGASYFSCQTSAISAGRQRLSEGHHALAGLADGAGLLPMDPAEVPNQSEPADALRATTSQLFSEGENGASRKLTLKVAAAFFASF